MNLLHRGIDVVFHAPDHDLIVVNKRVCGPGVAVVGPDDVWRSPSADASDEELLNTYGPLRSRRVVYGHIHRAYVRRPPSFTLANSGSVSLS